MVVKISSKHQVTIPKNIAEIFNLKKGDVLEVAREGNMIIMTPKEVILEDKYSKEDLEKAEELLSKERPHVEKTFKSGDAMLQHFKKKVKKWDILFFPRLTKNLILFASKTKKTLF